MIGMAPEPKTPYRHPRQCKKHERVHCAYCSKGTYRCRNCGEKCGRENYVRDGLCEECREAKARMKRAFGVEMPAEKPRIIRDISHQLRRYTT